MSTIGYLGPGGSFTEEALYTFTASQPAINPAQLRMFPSIPQLLTACAGREIEWAFVPIENSTEGPVVATMDALGQAGNLLIHREYNHPVQQCLMAKQKISHSSIMKIYSHEQGLGQCRTYLSKYLPHAEQVVCTSTAEAARLVAVSAAAVALQTATAAAIAPRRAAQLYDLYCIEESIQDGNYNTTRFVLIGNHVPALPVEPVPFPDAKTSLLIKTANTPGALYEALGEFARRQINLTRIESRPSKQKLGEYVFFIDVDGHILAPAMQESLASLKEKDVWTKLLGSYPKAVLP